MPPSLRCAAPRTPRTRPGANVTSHAPLHMQVGDARRRPSSRRPRCRQPTAGAAAGVPWHALCRWTRGRAAARRRTRRSRQWLDSACSTRSFGGCWQPDRPAAQGSGAAFWRRIGGLRWYDEAHARCHCRWRPWRAARGSCWTVVSLGVYTRHLCRPGRARPMMWAPSRSRTTHLFQLFVISQLKHESCYELDTLDASTRFVPTLLTHVHASQHEKAGPARDPRFRHP